MNIKKFNEFVNEQEDFGLIGKEGRNLYSDRPDSIDSFRTALLSFKNVKNVQNVSKDEAFQENFTFDATVNGRLAQYRITNRWTKLILQCPEIQLTETILTRLDQLAGLLSHNNL